MGNHEQTCCKPMINQNDDQIVRNVDKNQQYDDSISLNKNNLSQRKQEGTPKKNQINQQTTDPIKPEQNHQATQPKNDQQNQQSNSTKKPNQQLPPLTFPNLPPNIQTVLQLKQPFTQKLTQHPVKNYQQLIYQGYTNQEGKPQGFGRLYYPKSGAFLIGNFYQGLASGIGLYVWPNGSYYSGQFINNKASDQNCEYKCSDFLYRGSVQENKLDGAGSQKGNSYNFIGKYKNNKRISGKLTWIQKQRQSDDQQPNNTNIQQDATYIYQGNLDDNDEFTGEAILKGPLGIYRGNFENGLKNGHGTFQFTNQIRYQGNYQNGLKQGKGTIFTRYNKTAYSGDMANNIPHGHGWIPDVNGKLVQKQFENGISTDYI